MKNILFNLAFIIVFINSLSYSMESNRSKESSISKGVCSWGKLPIDYCDEDDERRVLEFVCPTRGVLIASIAKGSVDKNSISICDKSNKVEFCDTEESDEEGHPKHLVLSPAEEQEVVKTLWLDRGDKLLPILGGIKHLLAPAASTTIILKSSVLNEEGVAVQDGGVYSSKYLGLATTRLQDCIVSEFYHPSHKIEIYEKEESVRAQLARLNR